MSEFGYRVDSWNPLLDHSLLNDQKMGYTNPPHSKTLAFLKTLPQMGFPTIKLLIDNPKTDKFGANK